MTIALSLARDRAAPRPPGSLFAIVRLVTPLVAFFLIPSGVSLFVLAFLGRVGTTALAGVGAAGALYGILLALLFGLDAAVQASVARAVGAGQTRANTTIYTDAVALGAPLGVCLAAALWAGAPVVLPALIRDGPAAQAGVAWARAASPSLVFFALTIPANAVWVGWGRPARALIVTAATAPIQIAASYVLMLGGSRPLGAAGAGAAMSVAGCAAVGAQLWLLTRRDGVPGLGRHSPSVAGVARLAKLGWPISLQQSLNQVALMIAYPLVARLGAPSLAIVNVLIS
jgi:Na+-driven multidrug efflux pump